MGFVNLLQRLWRRLNPHDDNSRKADEAMGVSPPPSDPSKNDQIVLPSDPSFQNTVAHIKYLVSLAEAQAPSNRQPGDGTGVEQKQQAHKLQNDEFKEDKERQKREEKGGKSENLVLGLIFTGSLALIGYSVWWFLGSRFFRRKNRDEFASTEVPMGSTVKFEDVVGHTRVKEDLYWQAVLPFMFPRLFTDQLLRPPLGILLYGPPGTGKSMLASAVAGEGNATFLSITPTDLVSSLMGSTASKVNRLFDTARKRAPTVIFIDEADGLLCHRSTGGGDVGQEMNLAKSQLLQKWSGLETNLAQRQRPVIVICATNEARSIDSAARRRLQCQLEVGPLTPEEQIQFHGRPRESERPEPGQGPPRPEIAVLQSIQRNHSTIRMRKGRDLQDLLNSPERQHLVVRPGASGADCAEVMRRAAYIALQRHIAQLVESRAAGLLQRNQEWVRPPPRPIVQEETFVQGGPRAVAPGAAPEGEGAAPEGEGAAPEGEGAVPARPCRDLSISAGDFLAALDKVRPQPPAGEEADPQVQAGQDIQ